MLQTGEGIKKNLKQGAELLETSCKLGFNEGCYNLAIAVRKGRGVPKDNAKAKRLLNLACSQGLDAACRRLKKRP